MHHFDCQPIVVHRQKKKEARMKYILGGPSRLR